MSDAGEQIESILADVQSFRNMAAHFNAEIRRKLLVLQRGDEATGRHEAIANAESALEQAVRGISNFSMIEVGELCNAYGVEIPVFKGTL